MGDAVPARSGKTGWTGIKGSTLTSLSNGNSWMKRYLKFFSLDFRRDEGDEKFAS